MTKREQRIWILAILAVAFIAGPASYFGYLRAVDASAREVEAGRVESDAMLLRERERTARSENRWEKADEMLQRLPFVKKDE